MTASPHPTPAQIQQALGTLMASVAHPTGADLNELNGLIFTGTTQVRFTPAGRKMGHFIQLRTPTHQTAYEDHTHDFFEISFILDGQAQHRSGSQTYPVSTGDLFFLNHRLPHRFLVPKGGHLTVLNLHFLPEFLEAHLSLAKLSAGYEFFMLEPFMRSMGETGAKLKLSGAPFLRLASLGLLLLDDWHRAWPKASPTFPAMFRTFLTRATDEFLRQMQGPTAESRGQQKLFEDILAWLEPRLHEPLRVGELGRALGVGKTRLHEIFKAKQGSSIIHFVRQRRVERAKVLLSQTDMPVVEIALEAGFGDLSNFNRTFKALAGITPSRHRASVKRER